MRRTLVIFALAAAFSAYGGDKCLDLCKQISKPCFDPCNKVSRPGPKAECRKQCEMISGTCKESCAQKGKVDPEFMRAELQKRMPKGGGAEGGRSHASGSEKSGASDGTTP